MKTEYQVVEANTPGLLSNIVTSLIKEGWTPYGSHQVVIIHTNYTYDFVANAPDRLAFVGSVSVYTQTMLKSNV